MMEQLAERRMMRESRLKEENAKLLYVRHLEQYTLI
jgi:hypothetical protein